MIVCRSAAELKRMQEAGRLVGEVLSELASRVAPGVNTADDAWEQDVYESELDDAIADLESQASDFRAEGPEVVDAFWAGVQSGLDA